MLALALENKTSKLEAVRVRKESDGSDRFLAVDLAVSCVCDADILEAFDPKLKDMFFVEKVGAPGTDLATSLVLRPTFLTLPLHSEEEMVGVKVSMAYGVGGPMVYPGARVNKVSLMPKDGGVVVVSFRIQTRVSDVQLGRLGHMLDEDFALGVAPPAKAPLPQIA